MKKKSILIGIGIILFSLVKGQDQIGILFSQNLSTFRFIDSDSNKEDLDISINYGYGFTYSKELSDLFFISGLLSYDNKGATDVFDEEKLEWSFHYVGASINGGAKFTLGRWSPKIGAGMYYGRLLKAEQYIGSQYYDLMSDDVLNKNDIGVNVFGGISYSFSKTGNIFLKLNQNMGLLQLEESEGSNQKMYNRVFSIQTGFTFNIN